MTVEPFPGKRAWIDQCILGDGKNPKPLAILANAMIALRSDPAIRDALAYDEMLAAPILVHPIGEHFGADFSHRLLTDDDLTKIQQWMQENGLKRISRETTRDAVNSYARENSYHPVRDYLETLQWDRTRRAIVWLTTNGAR
jgi:hypothetical protein